MDFLVAAAGNMRRGLEELLATSGSRSASDRESAADVTDAQIEEVVEEIKAALLRVSHAESESQGRQEAKMWLPNEPILAILQTALTAAYNADPQHLVADADGVATQRLTADARAEDLAWQQRALGKFEVTGKWLLGDPGWLWMKVIRWWYSSKPKVSFGGLPTSAIKVADTARIVLLGDWGTGLDRAQDVASQIRTVLDEGLAAGRDQHVVHLGDVYYTGAEDEYKERFLKYWPVRESEPITSYIICGNHDLYRGGHAYYNVALADPRFKPQDGRSVFALRNNFWQFLGLDTAYIERELSDEQLKWIAKQRNDAPHLRTALMSHHPYFSAYGSGGTRLRAQLSAQLEEKRVDAWFWGHEHRCLVYEPRYNVDFASCVGHGGVPSYLLAPKEPTWLRYDYRDKHGRGIEPWNTFGFAVVDLDESKMSVRYINEYGKEHYSASL
jgi:predicted phosphodiesterase